MLWFVVPTSDLGVNDSCSRIDKENPWNCIQDICRVLQSRWCGWETKHFKIRERCLGGSKQLHTSQTTHKKTPTQNAITQLVSAIFRCHLYHAKLVGSSPTIVVFIQGTSSEIAWYGEALGNGGDSIAPGVGDWAVQIEGGRRTKYLKGSLRIPIPSMGLVYLPTCTIKDQPNVGYFMAHQDINHIIYFSNYATVMSLNDTVDGSEIPNNHLGWC